MLVARGSVAVWPIAAAALHVRPRFRSAASWRWWVVLMLALIAVHLLFSLPLGVPARSAPVDVFQAQLETSLASHQRNADEQSVLTALPVPGRASA